MTFEQFCEARGFDPAVLTDRQRAALMADYQRSQAPPPPVARPVVENPAGPASPAAAAGSDYDSERAAIVAEGQRRAAIRKLTLDACKNRINYPDKCKQFEQLCEAAIADPAIDARQFERDLLLADKDFGPVIVMKETEPVTTEILEAAACRTHRLIDVEKKYSDRTLQAAKDKFPRGLGITDILRIAAEQNNGYRGTSRDTRALITAAMRPRPESYGGAYHLRADGGPSTIATPTIFQNIGNKFLEQGFYFSEQAWRNWVSIKTGNDYKTITRIRATGDNIFVKVSPSGEIHDGTLSELTYTNAIEIYGVKLGLSEKQMRNDDLGAFTDLNLEIGRGGGDAINRDLYTAWLADSSFFNTDKSKNNYDDGSTDSVLSLAGLDNASTILRKQTKPDGTYMGKTPRILLVPAALENTAMQLMGSQGLVVGTTPASGPGNNVFYGRYRVVSSVYLDASSSTAWYLLLDPNDVAAMEIAFLDGVDTPTIETAEWDIDSLGMSMRGTLRYGVALQEYRAGVKLKGAA